MQPKKVLNNIGVPRFNDFSLYSILEKIRNTDYLSYPGVWLKSRKRI
jgi:hypothetical protein